MKDLSLNEIAERIVEAVLSQPYLNKEGLTEIIRPILKIWLKQSDKPINQKASNNEMIRSIQRKEIEQKFWHNKYKAIVSKSKIEEDYQEFQELIKAEGLHEIKDKAFSS